METPQKYAHIVGWGADLDHANRPAYPRERKPNRLEGIHWQEPPEQQTSDVEILKSNERPAMTPLFGTTVPPTGISGNMRRFAFRFSENDLRHWLLLLAADRVNMVEGLFEDFGKGHVPNVYAEMGGRAEVRHNPLGAAKKALVLTALIGGAYLFFTRGSDRRTLKTLRRR